MEVLVLEEKPGDLYLPPILALELRLAVRVAFLSTPCGAAAALANAGLVVVGRLPIVRWHLPSRCSMAVSGRNICSGRTAAGGRISLYAPNPRAAILLGIVGGLCF